MLLHSNVITRIQIVSKVLSRDLPNTKLKFLVPLSIFWISGIFYRYCLFLRDSGYREKAITSLQAMLEFNLFSPPTLKSVLRETKIAAFEEYWDSGSARIGFPGALGWKCWVGHKERTSAISPVKEGN